MEVVFHNALQQSPSVLSEFATSGQTDLSEFMYRDTSRLAFAHIIVGPGGDYRRRRRSDGIDEVLKNS